MRIFEALLLITITSTFAGCAGTLYNRAAAISNPVEKPAVVDRNFARITQSTAYDFSSNWKTFIFQLTPVGIFAPLFGYPAKTVTYAGVLAIRPSSQAASTRVAPNRELATGTLPEGGSWNTTLNFNEGSHAELNATGRTVEFLPEKVDISMRCKNGACSITASPPIITDDGSIPLQSTEIVDRKRLEEIRVAEQKAKLAAEEARRRAVAAAKQREAAALQWERNLPSLQAQKCPTLTVELQALNAAANEAARQIGPEKAASRIAATFSEWKLYRCDFWIMRQSR